MQIDYAKLAEKYLSIARQVTKELQANEDVIGIAAIGSTAIGDVHLLSDIDLLVLVKESGVFNWERKTIQNIVVNLSVRSQDVLERMSKDHPDTIFGLKGALILYDPQGTLQSIKKSATITEPLKKELIGDLLDEARSFIGKAEKALAESRLESSILCLRQGAIKLAELIHYKDRGKRINPLYMWEEIQELTYSHVFKKLLAEVHGFIVVDKPWLIKALKKLKTFLPKPGEEDKVRKLLAKCACA